MMAMIVNEVICNGGSSPLPKTYLGLYLLCGKKPLLGGNEGLMVIIGRSWREG